MKKILTALLLITLFFTIRAHSINTPKNIIMIVGDGMGPAYTTAYRYFKDNPETLYVESTVFDRLLIGRASTYPAHVSHFVTDSAAAGTALATGHKTYNGAIGVDKDKKVVKSVLEFAKSKGKATGVVVTSQINHATPASYIAHVESREMYNKIANSYFDDKINGQFKVDVMFGGGWKYFIREDRNLKNEFMKAGYQYINNYDQLSKVKNNRVLGLFADKGLPWSLDDPTPHRLKKMTVAAIDRLDNNDKGFFLLIEASQIDWAGHNNDIAAAMAEMDDLNATVIWLEGYVRRHPETLVIMTADHSTGGFTIGAKNQYRWEPEFIRNLRAAPQTIAKKVHDGSLNRKKISKLLGFELIANECLAIENAYLNGQEALYSAIKKIIDERTNTGWTTSGHTAVDVPIFALGASKMEFEGQIDNTDIARKIFKLLGK